MPVARNVCPMSRKIIERDESIPIRAYLFHNFCPHCGMPLRMIVFSSGPNWYYGTHLIPTTENTARVPAGGDAS